MEHFIISGLNEQQTLVCLIVAAFAFIGAAEYLIGLMAAKSVAPAFVPAFWQSGDGDGGCGNRVVKCDLMSVRGGGKDDVRQEVYPRDQFACFLFRRGT